MSPIICGSIHKGHEWFSDYSRGSHEIFICLAVLLREQFFCLLFSSSEVLGKITSIWSKLPTAAR